MTHGTRKSICIKVEVSCPWIANKWFWNFNILTLEPMTCIVSGLGFSLVSNQKNLRVVSRLIWKKDKRTQKNISIFIYQKIMQLGESQWLYCFFLLTCCLVSAISMMFLKLMLDVTNNELLFSPEGIWACKIVEKRAFKIRCRNAKYLKTRKSAGMWEANKEYLKFKQI